MTTIFRYHLISKACFLPVAWGSFETHACSSEQVLKPQASKYVYSQLTMTSQPLMKLGFTVSFITTLSLGKIRIVQGAASSGL